MPVPMNAMTSPLQVIHNMFDSRSPGSSWEREVEDHTRAPEEQLVAKSAELSKQKAAAAKMKDLIAQVVNNPDILEQIFKFLDPDSIKSASLVCR